MLTSVVPKPFEHQVPQYDYYFVSAENDGVYSKNPDAALFESIRFEECLAFIKNARETDDSDYAIVDTNGNAYSFVIH